MPDIGSRWELFVDHFLLERLDGARLRLHPPTPREVVLPFVKPWEGNVAFYVTIMEYGNEYRAYYRGLAGEGNVATACVATSQDGIHWERPHLGLFEWDGSKENNLIWVGEGGHNFSPFYDTNPAAKPSERFKAVGSGQRNGKPVLLAFVSEDGYRWRKLRDEPIITDGAFDSQNLVFWDAYRGHYVAFYRDFVKVSEERHGSIRAVKHATSDDFVHWTPGQWFDYGGKPLEHFYTNATISYFRAPHLYLAFPKRFVPQRKRIPTHEADGVSDGVFMSSRDGVHWDRTFMEAFLRPGRDWQNWTERNNCIAWGLLPTAPGELSLYWVEHYRHPTCRLRRGTLRMDGFASIYAGYGGGTVLTRPLTFAGSHLVLNYSTSAAGSLRVEVLDATGHVLAESPELYGDRIEGVIPWQNGATIGHLAGQPVRLRFTLRDADVYALRFQP